MQKYVTLVPCPSFLYSLLVIQEASPDLSDRACVDDDEAIIPRSDIIFHAQGVFISDELQILFLTL